MCNYNTIGRRTVAPTVDRSTRTGDHNVGYGAPSGQYRMPESVKVAGRDWEFGQWSAPQSQKLWRTKEFDSCTKRASKGNTSTLLETA
jgi:hypothetical protein